jgi:SAM-dependent methyltransferase
VLPEGGSVLDVGVGGGAASLLLAPRAARIVGVDSSEELLRVFGSAAEATGVRAVTVLGRWPDVADAVDAEDVVVCSHVLYNVQDLEPFIRALDRHARHRVVIEITGRHPLAWMSDLWRRFHGLERPARPTADDAVAADSARAGSSGARTPWRWCVAACASPPSAMTRSRRRSGLAWSNTRGCGRRDPPSKRCRRSGGTGSAEPYRRLRET